MVEAARIDVGLGLNSASFETAAQRARRVMQESMMGVQQDVSKTRLAMEGLSGAVTGFASSFAKTLVIGGAVAGIGTAFRSAIREASEAQAAQVKFQAVLRATGNTAGVTAEQVGHLADQMEATGTVTAESVQGAAAILATFKSVAGDTFTTAIKLANDLSVVFGQDITSSATQLGKALEDPIKGISALARVGVTFSEQQKEVIKQFVETGEKAKAQGVILQTLAGQVGGVADEMGNTLTGAANRATAAIGNMLEELAKVPILGKSLVDVLDNATKGAAYVAEAVQARLSVASPTGTPPAAIADQQAALQRQLITLQTARDRATNIGATPEEIASYTKEIAALTTQQAALEKAAGFAAEANKRLNTELQTQEEISRRVRQGDGSFGGVGLQLGGDAPIPVSRPADAAEEATRAIQTIATAREDASARALQSLKDEGAETERLTDAVAKLHATIRARPEAPTAGELDASIIATENANRAAAAARTAPKAAVDTARDNTAIMRDILVQPWRDLAGDVADISTQMFDDMLSKGKVSAGDLADGIADTLRTTLTGTLGNLITLPIQTAISKIASESMAPGGDLGSALMKFGTEHPYMASGALGAAGGFAAGSIYSQAAGLKPGNQAALGGAIGGGIGAAAGFYFGGVGGAAVGGTLGSAAGSALGGMFGGENNMGNDRSSQTYRTGPGRITYSDQSFSPENRGITSGILGEVGKLQEALEALGGTFRKLNIAVQAGNKTGITVNGVKYGTAEEAVRGSIEKLLTVSTGGLTASQQTVLGTSKGGSAQAVLQDVQFADQFDALTFQGREVDRTLKALADTFGQAGRRARELGLDVNALAQAHEREADKVIADFQAQQQALSAQLGQLQGGNPLDLALAGLNQEMVGLAASAQELGVPLEQVTAAHQHQVQVLVEQYQQQQRNVQAQIAAVRGDNSLAAQLFVLETQMRDLAKSASDLGLSLADVAQAHDAAAQAIVRAYGQMQRNVTGQLAAAAGDQSLGTALYNLQTQFNDLAQSAAAAGIPMEQVSAAHQAAAEQLVREDAERQQQEAEARQQKAEAARQQAEQRRKEAEAAREARFRLGQDQRGLWSQLAALGGDTSLKAALFDLNTQFIELRHSAQELGVPLAQVTAVQKLATEELLRQRDQSSRGVRGQIAATAGDTSLGTQLYVLETQMRDMAKAAADLGIPLKLVTQASQLAAQELLRQYEQQQRGVNAQIAAAAGDNSLSTQLYNLDTQMRELAKTAGDVGIPLESVTRAHQYAAQAIYEAWRVRLQEMQKQQRDMAQSIVEAQRSAGGALDQFINPIKQALGSQGIGRGVFATVANTQAALEEFRGTLGKAQSGDLGALSDLAGAGGAAVQSARETYGSGTQFAAVYREIEAGLRQEQGQLEARRDEVLKSIGDYTEATVDELIRIRVEALADLRTQFDRLSRDVVAAVEGRA